MKHGILVVFLLLNGAYLYPETQEKFWTDINIKAKESFWGQVESQSGPGSSLEQTAVVRQLLPQIIKNYSIKSIFDAPCGDFNWMSSVDLSDCFYIGCDIVKPLIEDNIKKYKAFNCDFMHLDVTKDLLPQTDLIICRDLLVHLCLKDIRSALYNFKRSGAKYLLTTTFTNNRSDLNGDIASGGWRTVNLQRHPFNFPEPLLIINEHCTEQNGAYNDKCMALWDLTKINLPKN